MNTGSRSHRGAGMRKLLLGTGIWLGAVGLANSAVVLDFDQNSYVISPGQTFEVNVVLDADSTVPGLQSLPEGLFSYGVKVEFDQAAVALVGIGEILVPAALNFNGFSSGATKQTGSGFAGVKGNIDQSVFQSYLGSLLVTIQFEDLGSGTPYRLDLKIFRTLGDSEQVFLNGTGAVLDGSVILGSAQVSPVPEPQVSAMLAVGVMGLLGALGRLRRSPAHKAARHVARASAQQDVK